MYQVDTDGVALDQLAALPNEALLGYAGVLGVLELVPWVGSPQHEGNSEAAVRQYVFGPNGQGMVIYLILEDQLRVDVLEVIWVG